MKNICVMCRDVYDAEAVTFEQRLVVDEEFCPHCWVDIMTSTYDGELENDFSKLKIPMR